MFHDHIGNMCHQRETMEDKQIILIGKSWSMIATEEWNNAVKRSCAPKIADTNTANEWLGVQNKH